ncbi:MAG: deoxyguanosinetriphosphate triphosphohydrolase [Paracoccaceae bacterium]
MIAPHAVTATAGRLHPEAEASMRTPWQRDRDRIVHATAFRRLKHKTQVFVEHEGDHFRTRLTHSIEVAQVARTMARSLGLNEDLTEAVALAHDLGHPPFGHTGEDALAELMAPFGGYDHNAQAVRIVTHLERRYAGFDGLNLTWETLEGIAKHNGPVGDPVPQALAEYDAVHPLHLGTHASLEAQVAALADDVAYNNHDLQDGLRAALFDEGDLARLPILSDCFAEVDARHPGLDGYRRRHEALRRFFGVLVEDVVTTTRGRVAELAPGTAEDVRMAGRPMARFSDGLWRNLQTIRGFLFERMYRAPRVVVMRRDCAEVLRTIFPAILDAPDLLPLRWQADVAACADRRALARVVCDYVAGMTDRYAYQTRDRLARGD